MITYIQDPDPVKQRSLIDEVMGLLVYPNVDKPMRITVDREETLESPKIGDRFDRYRKGDMRITIEVKMGSGDEE